MKEKDIVEKVLLMQKDVFADLINVFVFHGEPIVREEELEICHPSSAYEANGRLRSQERDVAMYWKRDKKILALFGIGNQSSRYRYMPLRGFGYDGAAYRSQIPANRGSYKGKWKRRKSRPKRMHCYPVISLVLYYGASRWKSGLRLHEILDYPKEHRDVMEPWVNDYRVHVVDVYDLSAKQLSAFRSDFGPVAEMLVKARTGEDYTPSDRPLDHPAEVLNMIGTLLGWELADRLRKELYETESRKGEEVVTMKNMFDIMCERASEEARAEGHLEERGTMSAMFRRLVKNQMAVTGYSLEKTLDQMGATEEDRKLLRFR